MLLAYYQYKVLHNAYFSHTVVWCNADTKLSKTNFIQSYYINFLQMRSIHSKCKTTKRANSRIQI
uniref:Putative ovule protein n=1 Tax=Solanum chacoense TaxID=4108 RepID=A0A0V0GN21_SOLCH